MTTQQELIADLQTLHEISQTLNRAADMQGALRESLAHLVAIMGLETGWIFLSDPSATDRWGGRGFVLAAHHNLPPALSVTSPHAWDKNCDCQTLCREGRLNEAYNEVRCSRLADVSGDRRDLAVHASAPLTSAGKNVGILNVAAPDWSAFTPRTLLLLANVGSQIGIAVERARLYDALQSQRIQEQAMLLDLSQQLLSRRDLDDLMAFVVEEVPRLVGADACAILLLADDGSRLQFRAASGWRTDPVEAGHVVPADVYTGSGRVLDSQQPLVIPDLADQEPPLWMPDWLAQEAFRAAAIVPLVADGESIGTLVIDSRRPRAFSETEIRLLRLMANQVAIALETARLQQEEIQRQRIEEELDVGRKIQLSMLPPALPRLAGWQFAAAFEAARQVGGDFYDVFDLPGDPGRWGVVIADVSDKGVPAALFMALSRTTIRNIALRGRPPAEVIAWANRFIQEDSQSDLFLTAFYAELDSASGRLHYANAGHNPPLWWHAAEQRFTPLAPGCALLGVFADLEVPSATVQLSGGDVLVLYTDGITEAITEEYEEYGHERLQAVIAGCLTERPDASADAIRDAIIDSVRSFVGNMVQYDDMTLLVIKQVITHGD